MYYIKMFWNINKLNGDIRFVQPKNITEIYYDYKNGECKQSACNKEGFIFGFIARLIQIFYCFCTMNDKCEWINKGYLYRAVFLRIEVTIKCFCLLKIVILSNFCILELTKFYFVMNILERELSSLQYCSILKSLPILKIQGF